MGNVRNAEEKWLGLRLPAFLADSRRPVLPRPSPSKNVFLSKLLLTN